MVRIEGPQETVRKVFCGGILPAACCFFTLVFPVLVFSAQPTPQQMVRLSIASTEADWKATPHFSYAERDANVKGGATTSKTYRVWMIDGSPYSRLISVGDEPLSSLQEAQEGAKLRKEISKRINESPKARAKRLAEYHKDRGRVFALIQEMPEAFDFKFVGEQKLDNRDVYVLQASPRPGYQPKSRETKILIGMKATLWIDKDTYQWAKVEAVVIKPVWMGWFIAKVMPGTRFLFEQTPVTKRLWLPAHFSVEVKARVAWLQKSYVHEETYRDYRLLSGQSLPEPVVVGKTPAQGGVCTNVNGDAEICDDRSWAKLTPGSLQTVKVPARGAYKQNRPVEIPKNVD